MKATGIVRRIDDLGRVVIPKEIRRTMHIRDGDPLEIYTDREGEVIFKKYSPMGELNLFTEQICETLHKSTGKITAITDRESVVSVFGASKREILEKRISSELEELMEERQSYRRSPADKKLPFIAKSEAPWVEIAVPILSQGDVLGCVVFLSSGDGEEFGELEMKLATIVSRVLAKQME